MHWRRGSRQVSTSLLQAARGVGVPSSTSCTAALGFSFRAARGVGGPCSTSSTAAFGFSFSALLGPTVEQQRGRIPSSCALLFGRAGQDHVGWIFRPMALEAFNRPALSQDRLSSAKGSSGAS